MSRIAEIQHKLLETNVALAELEKAIAVDRGSSALAAMFKSVQKRYRDLETDFEHEVDALGEDVCSYRVFRDGAVPTLKGLSSVLGDFQSLVSTVYDAVKSQVPKMRARISVEIASATEFRFAYTYPGSVGVVLTLPNERRLLGESALDESIQAIANMAKVERPSDVLQYAQRFGPATVRALYRWAYDHAESGLGVDIEWRRQQVVRTHLLTQRPEFEKLHHTISITSEETVSEETLVGSLVGADVERQSFHLRLENGDDIRGRLAVALNKEQTIELPKRYRARLVRTHKISYSTEEELDSYQLTGLEAPETSA